MQNTEEKIYFNFSYFALKLLGKGLYNNPWNAIAELVANGLDAQATSVKLYINMSDKKHSTIEILDNGIGMDYDDLAEKYVFMGKDKRQDKNVAENIRNSYMGRKGIGKLAALYLSKKYYLITKTDHSNEFAWVLDTKMPNESDIPHLEKEQINNIKIECVDNWIQFKTGTMIKLTDVDLTGIGGQTIEGIKARLADFFLLDTLKSKIEVCVIDNQNSPKIFQPVEKSIAFKNFYAFFNNTELDFTNKLSNTVVITNPNYPEISDKKRLVQYIDKRDFLTKGKDFFKLKNDELSSGEIEYELKGWIGIHTSVDKEDAQLNDTNFLKNKAYKPNQLRLYVRKKLAVENFFDIYKNNQVFANYIEGEISFDILDDDRFEDIATTNRQSLIQDDIRVEKLIELLKPVIGKLIRTRVQLSDEVKNEIKAIKEHEQAAKEKAEAEAKQEKKAKEKAQQEKKDAEEKAKKAQEAKEAAEKANIKTQKTLEQVNSENVFLRKTTNVDIDALLTTFHSVLNDSEAITEVINLYTPPTPSNINDLVVGVKEANQKIYTISKMATLKNFSDKKEPINGDFITFLKFYLKELSSYKYNKNIQFIDNLDDKYKLNKEFIPIEIILMMDNIVSNSKKAKAKLLELKTIKKGNSIFINIQDNGKGLYLDADKTLLFEKGKSYTNGSGLGLYQVKNVIKKLGGNIEYKETEVGFCLEVMFICN